MNHIVKILLLSVLIIFISRISFSNTSNKIFYITEDGNDSWSGTLLNPNQEKQTDPLQRLKERGMQFED